MNNDLELYRKYYKNGRQVWLAKEGNYCILYDTTISNDTYAPYIVKLFRTNYKEVALEYTIDYVRSIKDEE